MLCSANQMLNDSKTCKILNLAPQIMSFPLHFVFKNYSSLLMLCKKNYVVGGDYFVEKVCFFFFVFFFKK